MEKNKNLTPFKLCVLQNFPFIEEDFDALTNYGLMCKIVEYLNNVINQQNITGTNVNKLFDWFNDLDVQDEINKKLDSMAQSGELQTLLRELYSGVIYEVDTKISVLDSKVNSGFDSLKNQIDSVASGSPIPVSSTQYMTDRTKTYLLTTDGYWYYFNGSSWVQGGIYQASQDLHTTTYNNKYLKSLNIKDLIDWKVGDCNGENITPSEFRIVTNSIQQYDYDVILQYNEIYKIYVWYYDNITGTNPSGKGWIVNENRSLVVPKGQCFRLVVDYINTDDRVNINDAFTSRLFSLMEIYKYSDYKDASLKPYNYIEKNIKANFNYVIGDFNASTGAVNEYEISRNNRLILKDLLCLDYDLYIPQSKENEIASVYMYLWRSDGTYDHAIGYVNRQHPYVIPKGTYFKLMFAEYRTGLLPVVKDIYTSIVYNQIHMYDYASIIDNVMHSNVNCKSIAHQGYSITSQYFGNSRLSSYIGAKKHGFDFGECDIKWTSDNIPVCCHDNTFNSNGTTITISEHTYTDLLNYNYYGEKIASFDSVLLLCKKLGLGLYIDQVNNLSQERLNIMFAIVDKYQMENNVVWLTNNETTINRILSKYPNGSISIVTDSTYSNLTPIINLANRVKTNFNKISLDLYNNNISYNEIYDIKSRLNNDIDIEIWTIDDIDRYKAYLPYVTGITSNKISYQDVYADYIDIL